MALQNRVTPRGEIIETPARGTIMGNRGILHDDDRRIVRTSRNTMWLICRLEFKGRRRPLMSPGTYTELFFLDEAVALADRSGADHVELRLRDTARRAERSGQATQRVAAGTPNEGSSRRSAQWRVRIARR